MGGFLGLTSSEYNHAETVPGYGGGSYGYTYAYTGIAFGVRFAYHPNFWIKGLDIYPVLTLGYYLFGAKAEYQGDWPAGASKTDPARYDTFYFDLSLGGRYFFTNNIGVYAELGYNAFTYVKAGLTLKC